MNSGAWGLLWSGPIVVFALAAIVSTITIAAVGLGFLDSLAALGKCAARNQARHPLMLGGWGAAAILLILAVAVILLKTKALALLGLIALAIGLGIAALGMALSALRFGQKLARTVGMGYIAPLAAASVGLSLFVLAAILPFLGWLAVFVAISSGMGAVLEAIVRPERAA